MAGDRDTIAATRSARRSSGPRRSSSKNRGVGEGWATCVSSWARTSADRTSVPGERSRWTTSPMVAARFPTERSARRVVASLAMRTGRSGPTTASASGRRCSGNATGATDGALRSSVTNRSARSAVVRDVAATRPSAAPTVATRASDRPIDAIAPLVGGGSVVALAPLIAPALNAVPATACSEPGTRRMLRPAEASPASPAAARSARPSTPGPRATAETVRAALLPSTTGAPREVASTRITSTTNVPGRGRRNAGTSAAVCGTALRAASIADPLCSDHGEVRCTASGTGADLVGALGGEAGAGDSSTGYRSPGAWVSALATGNGGAGPANDAERDRTGPRTRDAVETGAPATSPVTARARRVTGRRSDENVCGRPSRRPTPCSRRGAAARETCLTGSSMTPTATSAVATPMIPGGGSGRARRPGRAVSSPAPASNGCGPSPGTMLSGSRRTSMLADASAARAGAVDAIGSSGPARLDGTITREPATGRVCAPPSSDGVAATGPPRSALPISRATVLPTEGSANDEPGMRRASRRPAPRSASPDPRSAAAPGVSGPNIPRASSAERKRSIRAAGPSCARERHEARIAGSPSRRSCPGRSGPSTPARCGACERVAAVRGARPRGVDVREVSMVRESCGFGHGTTRERAGAGAGPRCRPTTDQLVAADRRVLAECSCGHAASDSATISWRCSAEDGPSGARGRGRRARTAGPIGGGLDRVDHAPLLQQPTQRVDSACRRPTRRTGIDPPRHPGVRNVGRPLGQRRAEPIAPSVPRSRRGPPSCADAGRRRQGRSATPNSLRSMSTTRARPEPPRCGHPPRTEPAVGARPRPGPRLRWGGDATSRWRSRDRTRPTTGPPSRSTPVGAAAEPSRAAGAPG